MNVSGVRHAIRGKVDSSRYRGALARNRDLAGVKYLMGVLFDQNADSERPARPTARSKLRL